jgi:hypothetical protein
MTLKNGFIHMAIKDEHSDMVYTGTFIADDPEIVRIKTFSKKEDDKNLLWIQRKQYLEKFPEPQFSVCYLEEIGKLVKPLSLNKCGKMITLALCMEMDINGQLMHKSKPMKRKDIAKLWKMKDLKEVGKLINELIAMGFLENIENQNYRITEKYHTMGQVIKPPFAKLYHPTTQKIVKKVPDEAIGLLYKLLPWVHMNSGTICRNPTEEDMSKAQFLTSDVLPVELAISQNTLTKHMDILAAEGAILITKIGRVLKYQVHPRYVSRMDFFTARAIKTFIDENLVIAEEKRKNRSRKREQYPNSISPKDHLGEFTTS